MNKRHGLGFTLTELMIAVAIAGILASLAVPSFSRMIERNKLKEATESLKADLMFARTEAIKRSTNLNVSLATNGGSWCYGIDDDNTACDCSTPGDCAIKTVDGSQFEGTTLDADDDTVFNFRRGTATAIGSTLGTSHYSTRLRVSNTGRIRVCSPDSSKAIGAYDAC